MKVVTASGEVIDLGATETAPTIGITDYSRRVTDDYGVTTVVKRDFALRLTARIALPTGQVDSVQRRLAGLRATAATWIADNELQSLSVRGFVKDFAFDFAVPPISYCSLTVEGLGGDEPFADPGGDPAPLGQTSTLRLLQPAAISNAGLVASTAAEDDYDHWAAQTSYAIGARVIDTTRHRIYESSAAANVGNDPTGASGKWIDIGPTNRWAMFDQALGSVTSAHAALEVTLSVGSVNAVALLDVVAQSVRVRTGGYDRTLSGANGSVTFLDLPQTAAQIVVSITNTGPVSVGTLLIGQLVDLGVTESSPSAGITDYSRKDTDDFGEVTIVERAWAKRMGIAALIRTDAVDLVLGRIANVRAQPSLWIGDTELDSLTVYGFFKDCSIAVDQAVSKLTLTIEGLSTAGAVLPLKAAVDWPDVGDPVGTKPADNATVGGTIGVDIKLGDDPSPMPPSLVLNSALKLTPAGQLGYTNALGDLVPLGALQLEDLGAASVAASRHIDRTLNQLAVALQTALNEASRTRSVFTNAGFVVDPATGIVTISAIQQTADTLSQVSIRLSAAESAITLRASTTYVDNAIARAVLDPSQVPIFNGLEVRITSAEIKLDGLNGAVASKASTITVDALGARVTNAESDLDALTGQISSKVETSQFDALGARVSGAEQKLSALADTAEISSAISVSRSLVRDTDAAAKAALSAMLNGDLANRDIIQAIAAARQEITAKINDGLSAAVQARLALAARVAAGEAQAVTESKALVDAVGALVTQITTLSAVLDDTAASVRSEAAARAGADGTLTAGLADSVALSRTMGGNTAAAAESALAALLAGDAVKRSSGDELAAARDELTAKINGVEDILVQRYTVLLARLGVAEASAIVEQTVRAAAQSALAQSILALNATVGDNTAAIRSTNVAIVEGDKALSDRLDTVTARVRDAEAAASHEVQARSDGETVLSGEIDQLKGRVGDAEATARRDRQAMIDGDGALASELDTLDTRIGAAESTAITDRQARIDGEGALSSEINLLKSRVGDTEASATRETQARVDGIGVIAADVVTLRTTQAGHTATITEQATSINGLEARIGLDIDVGGHVVGYVANNDGKRGDLTFTFDRTRFLRPDGTLLFRAGSTDAGEDPTVVYMPNVVVDRLKINAAVIPAFVSMNSPIAGPGWSDAAGDGGSSGGGSTGPNKDLG